MVYFDKKATIKRKGITAVNWTSKVGYTDVYTLIPVNFDTAAAGRRVALTALAREDIVDTFVIAVPAEYSDIETWDQIDLYDVIAGTDKLRATCVVGTFDYQESVTSAIDVITLYATRRDG